MVREIKYREKLVAVFVAEKLLMLYVVGVPDLYVPVLVQPSTGPCRPFEVHRIKRTMETNCFYI